MTCIKRITDEEFGLTRSPLKNPRHRFGARGIIFNEKKEIAILFKKNKNEYKLIGGGLEKNESPKEAFKREALEETDCLVEIEKYLGWIEEEKSSDNFKQTSYIFSAQVIKNNHRTQFTEKELTEGSELLWVPIEKAIQLIKACEKKLTISDPKELYHTKFIVRRDFYILNVYLHSQNKLNNSQP